MQVDTKTLAEIIMADVPGLYSPREVLDLQKEFWQRLKIVADTPPGTVVPILLQNILLCDDEIISAALGPLGSKLKRFAREVDFSHPDLARIFGGAFANTSHFSQECNELLQLGQIAKQQSLHSILPSLSKIVTQDGVHRRISRQLDSPYVNRLHVRLLPDREARDEVRLMKRTQALDLESVYRRGQEFWTALPLSFKRFLRFDDSYKVEIERARSKAARYKELGCTVLHQEIEDSIVDYEQQVEDSYYGFNRITMTTAAVVLAKSLGYKLTKVGGYLYGQERRHTIEVQRDFFGDFVFDPAQLPPVTWEEKFNSRRGRLDAFQYSPRVYPLHEFIGIAPQTVRDTIEHLERFPDAGDKSIFDHFSVIVPGVKFPAEKDGKYAFLNKAGEYQEYEKYEDACKALDIILVESGCFHPVILGEKDNKCYFISYFA